MQKNPKISIIVPIYNAEKYIDRCMKTIYAQSFKDYEIILVNDGSKDNSAEICRKYEKADERVTFIDKENGGAGSARNAGIEVAKGEYLAFPDVDDWFEPEMYEELFSIAKREDYDVVFSGINFYGLNGEGKPEYSRTVTCDSVVYHTKEECRRNVMTFFPTSTVFDVPWNKLYKSSVIIDNNVRFSDTRRCQDAMFNIDFYNAIASAASTDKAYYNYIENTLSEVQRKFPQNYIDINIQYFSKLMEILSSWGMYKGKIKQHYDSSFVIAIYETMEMFENPVWDLSKKEQKEYINNIMSKSEISGFLKDADIRADVKYMYDILITKDYGKFMRRYKAKKMKDALRQNKAFMSIYQTIRGRK